MMGSLWSLLLLKEEEATRQSEEQILEKKIGTHQRRPLAAKSAKKGVPHVEDMVDFVYLRLYFRILT